MINAIYLFFGLDERNLRILYNAKTITPQKEEIYNYFDKRLNPNLILYKKEDDRYFSECRFMGKIISSKMLIDNDKIEIKIGRLNKVNSLFCSRHGFGIYKKNINKLYDIYVNNIKIQYEDEETFFSLGIMDDFYCVLKNKM